jgi:hypothetical protein
LFVETSPSEEFMIGVPQADVAVALPSAELMSETDGLHASATLS